MTEQDDLITLGEHLSACADALHARLLRALRQPTAGLTQDAAQALFEQEVQLRQHANSLYLEAARLATSGLGGAQQQLLALTQRAQWQISHIAHVKDCIALAAELLALGAAVAAGKPEHVLTQLEQLRHHLDTLAAANPAANSGAAD